MRKCSLICLFTIHKNGFYNFVSSCNLQLNNLPATVKQMNCSNKFTVTELMILFHLFGSYARHLLVVNSLR